jgi:hypothetical protein
MLRAKYPAPKVRNRPEGTRDHDSVAMGLAEPD